ncbi:MAG: hypothetical protein WAO22_04735 [bacterium]|jgi:hypothetical protein
MAGLKEKSCPMCGNLILDLGLSGDEGALCYACYRKVAAQQKKAQEA